MRLSLLKTFLRPYRCVTNVSILRLLSGPGPGRLAGDEVMIPVPWGVIAGRQWGDPSGHPWLGLHGWLDNAGTFDLLGPCFPPGYKLVAIDLPGHGLSSHYPWGLMYHYLEYLVIIERIQRHFGWGKFSLLGHSMGGGISSLYAGTFPDKIAALIMLDLTSPTFRSKEDVVRLTRKSVKDVLSIEERMERPEKVFSSFDDALERAMDGVNDTYGEEGITREAAKIFMKRGLKNNTDGFVYTRDLRHRARSLYGIPTEFLIEWAQNISCPHLIIAAQLMTIFAGIDEDKQIMEIYKQNPKFTCVKVKGSHHVHINEPEKVNPLIIKFIQELPLRD